MLESLTVRLGKRSYPIHFGVDLTRKVAEEAGALAAAGRRVAVLTDEHVVAAQAAPLVAMFGEAPRLVVPAGEGEKSLAGLGKVLDFLAAERIDRGGSLFTVGGGVIGDLGGFAAACYLRGIAFHQVPTTLLAMVDSSVGGKTGINLRAGKNLAGAFHQPRSVYVSTQFLTTLPPREFAAGMAEVIKYGLLGDADLFRQLTAAPVTVRSPELPAVIRRCCVAKARIVEADEFERAKDGGRALLNLGHTFGHAIEQVAGYGVYLHGEAVAIGLAAAARLSCMLGAIDEAAVELVESVLRAHALPVRLAAPLPLEALKEAAARDKKVRTGRPRFVLLRRIGEAATSEDIDSATVDAIWKKIGAI